MSKALWSAGVFQVGNKPGVVAKVLTHHIILPASCHPKISNKQWECWQQKYKQAVFSDEEIFMLLASQALLAPRVFAIYTAPDVAVNRNRVLYLEQWNHTVWEDAKLAVSKKHSFLPWRTNPLSIFFSVLRLAVSLNIKLGVLHEDCHAANVVVNSQKQMALIDFGKARWLRPEAELVWLATDFQPRFERWVVMNAKRPWRAAVNEFERDLLDGTYFSHKDTLGDIRRIVHFCHTIFAMF